MHPACHTTINNNNNNNNNNNIRSRSLDHNKLHYYTQHETDVNNNTTTAFVDNHYHKQERYINNNNSNNNNNNNGKNAHDLNSMPNNNKHGALTTRVSSTTANRTTINGSKQDEFIGARIPSTKDNRNIQQNQELMVKGKHTIDIHQHNYLHGVATTRIPSTSTTTNNTGSETTTTTALALKHHPHDKNSAVATVNNLRDRIFMRTFKATTEILNSYNDNKRVRWASDLVDVHTYKVPKSKKTSSWTVLRQKLRKAVTALKDDIDL